jgi:hypothetical protein
LAFDVGTLFRIVDRSGGGIRTASVTHQLLSTITANCNTLCSEKFAELCTAVTMDIGPSSTRCVRQAFLNRDGGIVSLDSSVCDPTLSHRLNEGSINQVYFFVVVCKDTWVQTFSYKEPRRTSNDDGISHFPLSAFQLDVMELTIAAMGRTDSPNSYITKVFTQQKKH